MEKRNNEQINIAPFETLIKKIDEFLDDSINPESYGGKKKLFEILLRVIAVLEEAGVNRCSFPDNLKEMLEANIFRDVDEEALYQEFLKHKFDPDASIIFKRAFGDVLILRAGKYGEKGRKDEAIRCCEIALEIGKLEAAIMLAELFVTEDKEKAKKYLEKAISLYENQDLELDVNKETIEFIYTDLGACYTDFNGEDNKSNARAVECFQKAALLEYGPAYYRLGYMYEHGFGCNQSDEIAIEYYKLAKKQEIEEAAEALKRLGVSEK